MYLIVENSEIDFKLQRKRFL